MIGRNGIELTQGTLQEASQDDNGKYLLDQGEEQVYMLDIIGEAVAQRLRKNKKTKSVDAVVAGEEIYFIEFKNTIRTHMPKNELYYKAHDSIFTYLFAFAPELSLDEFAKRATYIVVYNDHAPCKQKEKDSESIERTKNKLASFAKLSTSPLDKVHWGLEDLQGVLYKKIYTVDKEVFESQLKPVIWN